MRFNALISLVVCLVSTSSAFQSISPSPTKKIGKNTVVRSPPPKRMNDLSSTSLKASDVSSSWTEQRIHNTNWFRCSAIVLSIALAGQSPLSSALSAQAAATIHLLSFGTWFGTMAYTTFVLGITMFKNLPRQTFGKLQAKLFPKYFLLSTITIMLQVSVLSLVSVKGLNDRGMCVKCLGSYIFRFLLVGNIAYMHIDVYIETTCAPINPSSSRNTWTFFGYDTFESHFLGAIFDKDHVGAI